MQQTRRQFSMIVLLLSTWAGNQSANGQYTASYQTNIISGVTNYWAGDYVVGSNTFADALLIRNAGVLTNANGYVGYLPASSSNHVMVTGTNSVWNSGTWLELGYAGPGNSLVISNGGWVVAAGAKVGDASTSSGNTALITGAGSVWNNTGMCTIGSSGSSNKVTINKGGRLVSNFAVLGTWSSATNNSVLVSDSGSVWDDSAVASEITFGSFGSGNSLVVTNGGQVLGYYAYFGRFSSGNSALVTGPGSSFSVNCYIYTGYQGNNNSFTVANGATVSDKFCYISYSTGSSNNAVMVTGTNSSWQNSDSVFVGFDGVNGSLTLSNGATMSIGGAFAVSHDGALGVDATSSNNCAVVTGGGSVLNCADNVYVGLNGPVNSLVISNGGHAINNTGYVGSNPGSDGNSALVVGANSVWANSSDMYVGYFTVGNSLVISSGGRVINNYGFVGEVAGSDNNSVMVTGAGSVWTNGANMYVGCYGSGNSLVITNGGRANDDYGTVGYDTNSIYNQALVAGPGSVWSNNTVTFVGYSGSSNNLVISDGGLVSDYWGVIGEDYSSSDNIMSVESGGIWRNQEILVGDGGSHNALYVDGGSVSATNMTVGYTGLYNNNLVQLTDGQIIVTNQTHSAVLEVYGGGFLLAGGTLWVDTLIVTNEGAQFMYIGGTLIYRNLQLTPEFDADGDGIPNGWEQAHGLDPLNPDDAAADNDGDGMSNLQEYLAGTDPNNTASRFAITSLVLTNGHVRVSWSAVGGKSYVVQTNSALGASFADASFVITVPGTSETVTNYLDPGFVANNQARYYRVRLGP